MVELLGTIIYNIHKLAIRVLRWTFRNHAYIHAEMHPHLAVVIHGILQDFYSHTYTKHDEEKVKKMLATFEMLTPTYRNEEYEALLSRWHELYLSGAPQEEDAYAELSEVENRQQAYIDEGLEMFAKEFQGMWD